MTSTPCTSADHASLLPHSSSSVENCTNNDAEKHVQAPALELHQSLDDRNQSAQRASCRLAYILSGKELAPKAKNKLKQVKTPKSKSKSKSKRTAPPKPHNEQTTPKSIKKRGSAAAMKTKKTFSQNKPSGGTKHIQRMVTTPICNHNSKIEGVGPFLARIQSERGKKALEQHSGAPTSSNQATLVIRTREVD